MDFNEEEMEWLLRMTRRAVIFAMMNKSVNKDDPAKLEALISKLEKIQKNIPR